MPRIPRPRLPFRRKKDVQPPNDDLALIENSDGQGARMSFFSHLNELRIRVTRAFFAVVIGTFIGFFLADKVLAILQVPYCELVEQAEQCELVILGPTGGIVVFFRVALMLGAIIAMPMITYQVMMFVLPALKRGEKRIVLLSIPAITILFLVGVAFSWFILLRPALGFLEGFQPTIFKPEWTADLYLSFVTSLIFWMGVAFETPLVLFVLSVLGMVTPGALARNWRIAIVLSSIAAALITPTIDPVNMMLVMGPLMGLYAISIVLTFFGVRINRAGQVDPDVPYSAGA
ncbi:MAG: twin-arginine translocase subunit TatC [Anaerolineaceae bacterium]|nr:twin-arginine translocase subunit TatC [Anaerolineaceae bacterium]